MFTEKEVKAAKETRDEIITNNIQTLKAIYMAGEICMWDEMRTTAALAATPDSREEGKGEDDMAKDWVNNKIWDLTSLDEEEKNKFIQTICKMTGSELMKLFIAFKLKTHIECMCINDNDGQEFILSFRTLKDHLEHYKIPAESTPPAPVSDAVDDKFEFVEWVNESYTFIKSKIGIKAWVNFKENDVLVHGSDYHYITLINEVGKTLPALYTIFLTQKQKV